MAVYRGGGRIPQLRSEHQPKAFNKCWPGEKLEVLHNGPIIYYRAESPVSALLPLPNLLPPSPGPGQAQVKSAILISGL